MMLLLGMAPLSCARQPPAETAVAHEVYSREPLADLLARVSALVPEDFGAREAVRIERHALELSPRSLSNLLARPSASFTYRVRFQDHPTILKIDLTASKVDYGYVDVRFRTPDTALITAIREQIWASYLASLAPIGHVHLTVEEQVWPRGQPPTLVLSLRAIRVTGCRGNDIKHGFAQRADTLHLQLYGMISTPRTCPAWVIPAGMSRELHIAPGRHALVVEHRQRADRLSLEVTDSSTKLTTEQATFVEADERLRWRYPRNSFVVYCSDVEVAQAACEDVERWLARQPGIARFEFGPEGVNPYRPEPNTHPGERASFFRYDNEEALEAARRCFAAVEAQIRGPVGIHLTLETWMGEQITVQSGRASPRPHIALPRQVTAAPGCDTAA